MNTLEPGHAAFNGAHVPINGDQTPHLTVNGGVKSSSEKCNGVLAHNSTSPSADSPTTPISVTASPDVKIDIDYQEQESDVRHEPLQIKPIDRVDKLDGGSFISQVETPDIPSPNHTPSLVDDINMEESNVPVMNGMNGHVNGTASDVVMRDEDSQTPAPPPVTPDASMATIPSNGTSTSHSSPRDHPPPIDDDDMPPPAKRARMHSDADRASFMHSATPPPTSAAPPPSSAAMSIVEAVLTPPSSSSPAGPSNLSIAQFRFCQSTIRSLKKQKDAAPFLRPVDVIGLNIPHYPSIIKTPMDFSTIERKLNSSNPAKPDLNLQNPRYHNADEFIFDVRLIFQNCITFNGPDHAIAAMGKRVEAVFDKQVKQMPAAAEPKPPAPKKMATPTPPPPPPPPVVPAKKAQPVRRASTSMPVIRRSEAEVTARPKREIHPPPPKDLPYADAPKKHRKGKRVKDDGTAEQLKFCAKILQDLHRKQHYGIAHPFYEPVDWVKLDIPSYPKVVKKPMDLSTIRKKLENFEYSTAQKFFDDFKLMIRNCFLFNPAGTLVNQAGIELQRLFDEKWKSLPPLHEVSDEEEEEEEEDDSETERQRAIAMMESQIEAMRGNIAALKGTKPVKEKKKKEKKEKAPTASSSKAPPKQPKASSKKKGKKPISDDDVLSFEQKKDLSESIGKLDGVKLEKVIQIIHEGVPEIRDSTEEIELEIDLLPSAVLTKLYNFVIRPTRQPATKRSRTGKGTGTGGLKRKSMDEDVEAEKIRQLEERMALFDKGAGGAPVPAARRDDDSDHSSDSSGESDSSGSDSE